MNNFKNIYETIGLRYFYVVLFRKKQGVTYCPQTKIHNFKMWLLFKLTNGMKFKFYSDVDQRGIKWEYGSCH